MYLQPPCPFELLQFLSTKLYVLSTIKLFTLFETKVADKSVITLNLRKPCKFGRIFTLQHPLRIATTNFKYAFII